MRRVLHDFYPPVCMKLLTNVAVAMGPSSRLIISDMVMPEKVEPGTEMTPYWMDFNRKFSASKAQTAGFISETDRPVYSHDAKWN
jgi:hypothetical protein